MSPQGRGLVFGGSSGIGAAVVIAMAEKGAAVVAASRRGTASPGAVSGVECDVRDRSAVACALEEAGELDWVVNAAGVGYYAPVEAEYHAQWQAIMDTNVVGLLNILSVLNPRLRQFVQIGSLAALRPSRTPGNDVYGAAKQAGATLMARHRDGLRRSGVLTKLTMITPGFVGDTDFTGNFFTHAPEYARPLLSDFPPLSPADVAAIVAYALDAPANVELSELVIRPLRQPD